MPEVLISTVEACHLCVGAVSHQSCFSSGTELRMADCDLGRKCQDVLNTAKDGASGLGLGQAAVPTSNEEGGRSD
jgi:hypothetical protein